MSERRLAVYLVLFLSIAFSSIRSEARWCRRGGCGGGFVQTWQPPVYYYPSGHGGYTPAAPTSTHYPATSSSFDDDELDPQTFTWSGRSGHDLVALLTSHLGFLGGEHATFELKGPCSGHQPWLNSPVAFNLDSHGRLRIGWSDFEVIHGENGWVTLRRQVPGYWRYNVWYPGTWEEHRFRDVGSLHGTPVLQYARIDSSGNRVSCRLDTVHSGDDWTPIADYFARLPQENEFQRRQRLFASWGAPSFEALTSWAGRHPTPLASNAFVVPLSCRNHSQGFQHDLRHEAPDFRLVIVNVNGQFFARLLKDAHSIGWSQISTGIVPLVQTADGLVASFPALSWSTGGVHLTLRASGGNFIARWTDGTTDHHGERVANYCSDSIAPGTTTVPAPGIPVTPAAPAATVATTAGSEPPVTTGTALPIDRGGPSERRNVD